jgi:hypothetical protein
VQAAHLRAQPADDPLGFGGRVDIEDMGIESHG